MAGTLSGETARRAARRTAAGRSTIDYRCAGRGCGHEDAGVHASQQHALEYATHGREDRAIADRHRADLARFRIAAASRGELQVLHRPAVRSRIFAWPRVVMKMFAG